MADSEATFEHSQFAVGAEFRNDVWVTVSQELIDGFGKYTLDPDPFHIDPGWAKENSPFGETIAFGFLTMSLLTHLLHNAQGAAARDTAADPRTHGYYLNYGFNRLRLITPVRVNARVQGIYRIKDITIDEKGRNIVTFAAEIVIEGEARPALVADWLAIWVPADAA
jgi:acyl dehydratase